MKASGFIAESSSRNANRPQTKNLTKLVKVDS